MTNSKYISGEFRKYDIFLCKIASLCLRSSLPRKTTNKEFSIVASAYEKNFQSFAFMLKYFSSFSYIGNSKNFKIKLHVFPSSLPLFIFSFITAATTRHRQQQQQQRQWHRQRQKMCHFTVNSCCCFSLSTAGYILGIADLLFHIVRFVYFQEFQFHTDYRLVIECKLIFLLLFIIPIFFLFSFRFKEIIKH